MSLPLSCPFCDSSDLDVDELDVKSFAVVCHTCKCIGPLHQGQSQAEAVAAWNRRPALDWLNQALNEGDGVYRP